MSKHPYESSITFCPQIEFWSQTRYFEIKNSVSITDILHFLSERKSETESHLEQYRQPAERKEESVPFIWFWYLDSIGLFRVTNWSRWYPFAAKQLNKGMPPCLCKRSVPLPMTVRVEFISANSDWSLEITETLVKLDEPSTNQTTHQKPNLNFISWRLTTPLSFFLFVLFKTRCTE